VNGYFETILFAKPESFRIAFHDCDHAIEELKKIAGSFPTIEHIDDGRTTAPSRRIISLIPAYKDRKTSAGPDIAEYTGLETIREKCPHFDAWLTRLEALWKRPPEAHVGDERSRFPVWREPDGSDRMTSFSASRAQPVAMSRDRLADDGTSRKGCAHAAAG
jgi:hypothetical protein